jgi:hypothetical protein
MLSIAPLVAGSNSLANHFLMEMTDKRRSKVTPENIEESRLLKAIWESTEAERAERGEKAQGVFGARYDIGNQGAVWQFLNGRTALSKQAALGFAKGLRCRVAEFSPRIAAEIEEMASSQYVATDSLDWFSVAMAVAMAHPHEDKRMLYVDFCKRVSTKAAELQSALRAKTHTA